MITVCLGNINEVGVGMLYGLSRGADPVLSISDFYWAIWNLPLDPEDQQAY